MQEGGRLFEGMKSLASITAGIALLILGSVPLLNIIGAIEWAIPEIPKIILEIILSLAGSYLIIDGFFEMGMHPGIAWISILFGLSCSLFGILSLLSGIGAFALGLAFMTATTIYVLFVLIGALLFIGAFMF